MAKRSEESTARQRACSREWHRAHPEYRKSRSPEARRREAERRKAWRANNAELVRAQRARYRARLPIYEELPGKFLGHPLFDTARYICGESPYYDFHLIWEERMGEVVLALLEGQDPVEADKRAAKVERQWIYHTAMLHPGTDISAETARVLYTSVRDKDH